MKAEKKSLGLFLALAASTSLKEGSRQGHRLYFKPRWLIQVNTHLHSTEVLKQWFHTFAISHAPWKKSSRYRCPALATHQKLSVWY